MRRIIVYVFIVFLISSPLLSQNDNMIQDSIGMKYDTSLQKIVKMYEDIKYLYAVFDKLYPIAIAENNQFYIFDVDENSNYKFIKKSPVSFPIPKGIRAAMPLEDYDSKCVCVVTGEVFDDLENRIIIFHEFVHCIQFQSVEMKLKEKLEVYKLAMENKNYMWELNFLFPYNSIAFGDVYSRFIDALENNDTVKIKDLRTILKLTFSINEYEYMTWQEWKEGYARYIENKLRTHFNLRINDNGKEKPFSRITFYSGGSKYIEYLILKDPKLESDLELLYKNITE
jgi:hypothetical protein